jgi:hypothetical protein
MRRSPVLEMRARAKDKVPGSVIKQPKVQLNREASKVSIRSRFSAPNSGSGAATTVVPSKRVEPESSGMQKMRHSSEVMKTAKTANADVTPAKVKRRKVEAAVAEQPHIQTAISPRSQATS